MQETPAERLNQSLKLANIPRPKPWYRPGEVKRIFGLSDGNFRRLCEEYVDPGNPGYKPGKLEHHMIGSERRVPHAALLRFIEETHCYNRIAAET